MNKIYKFGEKGSGFKARSTLQDFHKLREYHLEKKSLFEDPDFPADDTSLYYSESPEQPIKWMRPLEIYRDASFNVDGYSRFDVQQGSLSNCWFLAALSNFTMHKSIFSQIVPDGQDFNENYAGIFHFRFWQYGRWIDIVIDDRLPTVDGKLVFTHSTEENEFWSALLEKAYAKLCGSYEALEYGNSNEAMVDFTGGVTEWFQCDKLPSNFPSILLKAHERSSLMGGATKANPKMDVTPEGLGTGHAYSITKIVYIENPKSNNPENVLLLRLRNPWGDEVEWKGAWSDNSDEWKSIPQNKKEEIGLVKDNDGEFWMCYNDFLKHFYRVDMCHIDSDAVFQKETKNSWKTEFFAEKWVSDCTAGGCINCNTFCHNHQYRITLTNVDPEDDDSKCTVVVSLMLKHRRAQRDKRLNNVSIGFMIFPLTDPDNAPKPLDMNFILGNSPVPNTPGFVNSRETTCRLKLEPGTYCIIPSTFDPNIEAEFLLRVFSERKHNMEKYDVDIGLRPVDEKVEAEISKQETQVHVSGIHKIFWIFAGADKEVDWKALKLVLDYGMRNELKKGFSEDICRSLVAMHDEDLSGKLGFEAFKHLLTDFTKWKIAFKIYDENNSKALNGNKLRKCLKSAGYTINNTLLNNLMHRYGNDKHKIEFDEFIMCAIKLKTGIDLFKQRNEDATLGDWIKTSLYF